MATDVVARCWTAFLFVSLVATFCCLAATLKIKDIAAEEEMKNKKSGKKVRETLKQRYMEDKENKRRDHSYLCTPSVYV